MTVRERILEYVKNVGGEFSPSDVYSALGTLPSTTRKVISDLHTEGILARSVFRGRYVYEPETAFVYKFKGYRGTKWFMTFTADHELTPSEIQSLILDQSSDYGNIELIASGESTDFNESDLDGWDYEETSEDS